MNRNILMTALSATLLTSLGFNLGLYAAPNSTESATSSQPQEANQEQPQIYQETDQTDIYAIPLDNDALDEELEMERLQEIQQQHHQ